jgi:hypothetical protein
MFSKLLQLITAGGWLVTVCGARWGGALSVVPLIAHASACHATFLMMEFFRLAEFAAFGTPWYYWLVFLAGILSVFVALRLDCFGWCGVCMIDGY